MLSLIGMAQEAGTPWWRLLLSDVPHDAGAVVVYALIAAFVYFIWKGNRKRTE